MNCFAVAISVILLNTHSKSQLVSFQNNDDKNLVLQHKEIQEKRMHNALVRARKDFLEKQS